MNKQPDLPPILLKPGRDSTKELYSYFVTELDGLLSFRSLDLETDLDTIFYWVNQVYARRFWQLNGSKELVRKTYETILNNPRAHSFIGELNGIPICQIDIYGIMGEEMEGHIPAAELDCGLHLLMLPTKEMQKGWSFYALKNFQRFYFSFANHQLLIAEPDQENVLANKLAMDVGFQFSKTIRLSNKTANLYTLYREDFRPA